MKCHALVAQSGGPSPVTNASLPAGGGPCGSVPAGVRRDGCVFPCAVLAGRSSPGEYEATTDPVETDAAYPVLHVACSYACQLAILGPDDRLERIVAAHDSGLVVNPLAFEGQVEGGVTMGIGYAAEVQPRETIIVREAGQGSAA